MKRMLSVIGGDRRQAILAEKLEAAGYRVCTYGLAEWSRWETTLQKAVAADAVILPLPLCWEDGILNCKGETIPTKDLFGALGAGKPVLAGQVKPAQQQEAEERGIPICDYFRREEMTVINAAATAEAALQVAMERMERTLLGTECLVIGFGRIGKLLAHRLHGLGARVTVTARKPADLAWIDAFGWPALETGKLDGMLQPFRVVFNTVPSLILNEDLLKQLPADCLCVDLASVPGIDFQTAEAMDLTCVWARGLPGKLVPDTAAAAVFRAVDAVLTEWGDSI